MPLDRQCAQGVARRVGTKEQGHCHIPGISADCQVSGGSPSPTLAFCKTWEARAVANRDGNMNTTGLSSLRNTKSQAASGQARKRSSPAELLQVQSIQANPGIHS